MKSKYQTKVEESGYINKPEMSASNPYQFSKTAYEPATLLFEDGEDLNVVVELPDVPQENINIQWIENMLIISGVKTTKFEPGKRALWSKTYWSGPFQQSVNIGFVPNESSHIKAKFQEGVVTIKIKIPVSAKIKAEEVKVH